MGDNAALVCLSFIVLLACVLFVGTPDLLDALRALVLSLAGAGCRP